MELLQLLVGRLCVYCLSPQQHYHIPVPIPANADAHFKTFNVLDGSYHFGYDTGENKHELSYHHHNTNVSDFISYFQHTTENKHLP
jgi:hypothetical protein